MARLDLASFLPTDEDGKSEGSPNPQVLSGSSVSTYQRCQKQWEYAYVLQLRRPPSIKQGLGIAAHDAVGADLEQKVLTYQNLPVEEVVQTFEDAWDEIAADIEDITEEVRIGKRGKPLKERKENKARARESGRLAVATYHTEVGSKIQPVAVEEQVRFQINGIEWTGYLDNRDDRGRIRDQKFVSKRPDGGGVYFVPMVGYALGYRHQTGETESDVVLDNIVRTQEPYYLPIASNGPVTNEQVETFASIVSTVKRSIDAGIFMPTGLQTHACGWCGYSNICPAFRAANGGQNT